MNNSYMFINGKVLIDTDDGARVLDYNRNIIEILAEENLVEAIEGYLERYDIDLEKIDVRKSQIQTNGINGMYLLVLLDLVSLFTKYAPKNLEGLITLFGIEFGAVLGLSGLELLSCFRDEVTIEKRIALLESVKITILKDIEKLKREKDEYLVEGKIPDMESKPVYYEGMLTNILKWCEIDVRKERKKELKRIKREMGNRF